VAHEGLQPLEGRKISGRVVFRHVGEVWLRGEKGVEEKYSAATPPYHDDEETALKKRPHLATVVVHDGRITCIGAGHSACAAFIADAAETIDLKGGSILPALMSFGSPLGVEEIAGEPSTGDGVLYDPFRGDVPEVVGDKAGLVRAADALMFGTRNAL
jgi:hypothetical protein